MGKATLKPPLTLGLLACTLVWILWPNPSQAQGPWHFEATVDRTEITVDEKIVLTVVINPTTDASLKLILGHQPDFSVVNTSITEGSYTTDDQHKQLEIVHKYDLYPTKTGHLVLNPISIEFDNQRFSSEPIDIQVAENFAAKASLLASAAHFNVEDIETKLGHNRFFVEAEVDHLTPYLGQQMRYTFRLYQRDKPTGKAIYLKPAFEGFWVADQPSQKEYYLQANNATYYIFELQTALFPIKALPLSIQPSQATISNIDAMSDINLVSNAVDITVQPLPDNAPSHFQGAVGQFEIKATVDNQKIALDELTVFTMIIEGQGNIGALPSPIWPAMPAWESFDSEAQTETAFVDNRFGGVRKFVRTLIPLKAGKLIIPPVTYAFFDPEINAYRTLKTPPFVIEVTDQAATATVGVPALPATSLRPLKTTALSLQTQRLPLTALPNYWLSWGLPFIALGIYVAGYRGYRIYRNFRKKDQKKALKRAAYSLSVTDLTIKQTDEILLQYFADKFNYPRQKLNRETIITFLTQQGVEAGLIDRTTDLLRQTALRRYAVNLSDAIDDEKSSDRQIRLTALIKTLDLALEIGQQKPAKASEKYRPITAIHYVIQVATSWRWHIRGHAVNNRKSATHIQPPYDNKALFSSLNLFIFMFIAIVSFFCGWVMSHYLTLNHIQNELLALGVLLLGTTVIYLGYLKNR